MKDGIVILYKEAGMTSQTAVTKVKHLFGVEKAGHTGTLDPMATGVLPILIGRAVKASDYLLESSKHYKALLRLGVTTDTEDITGTILTTCNIYPTQEQVLKTISSFVGTISQVPPMYSALKRDGKKLVDLARKGITIEREPREITIYKLHCVPLNEMEYELDVYCSKGTYIRTLCADIGKALGCGGVMAALERCEAAGFQKEESHTLTELEQLTDEQKERLVVPIEKLFLEVPILKVSGFLEHLLKNGLAVEERKFKVDYPCGTQLRLYDENGFFALGIVEQEEFITIRVLKKFVLEEH